MNGEAECLPAMTWLAKTWERIQSERCCATLNKMSFSSAAIIGFLLGLGFGVGCALAVLYSIFLGGYTAAVRDSSLPVPPARLQRARASISSRGWF